MRVKLSSLPSPPTQYSITFPRLDGGLNTWEVDYRLAADESPEMKNLWWKDGALCCRDGQIRLTGEHIGTGYSAYERLFWEHGFFHIGDRLYCAALTDPDAASGSVALRQLCSGVEENRGTWFRYGDCLYYKNRGGYFRITYDEDNGFTAENVPAYCPVILINTDPTTAAGDSYQPENRLSAQKTVWYSTVQGVTTYQLPVKNVQSVDCVSVDDETLTEGTGYRVNLAEGTVSFVKEPTHHNPVVVNSVKITYSVRNEDAYRSIMDCQCAIVYGGNQNLCVVMGGSTAQPNAFFWCGSHTVMDPGYFPMTQYNLAGATQEAITGFGKQQNMLVIFKEHSVGRCSMGTTETASGRVLLTMNYASINSRVGCDLPHTIALVGNNLVFCNREQGVHWITDSSSAYENNIVAISRKVNNSLLPLIRGAESIVSMDDGSRYWVVADGEVYAWDYSLSTYSDPSWFYFDHIAGIAFLTSDAEDHYHLGADGSVSVMRRVFADYGNAIDKKYRFAAQNMGNYDRLKDVTEVILTLRGETDTQVEIEYTTDHEVRCDCTPIRSLSWCLTPRSLSYRALGVHRFAVTARRRPCCRHVRHFTMTLRNNEVGMDMSLVSAQIFYQFHGRDR